ncbi:PaaI family thioesterase [Gordonia sp. (in: high G+C Gram-positive bacteria)]|uniref:PaaI family thioesterase n=1 Tax=Gordonia sp. (in: high G+C Gram-positive bacteria) TaxID=84139 RepID=UPI003C735179
MENADHAIDVTQARGFDKFLGFTVSHADGDGIRGTMEITENHLQPFGLTHGGVYCALAESAASISGFCWLQETGIGGTAVGANNSTDFLRSATSGTLSVSTTPIHRGRRQQLWQIDITGDDGKLVAQSRVRLQNIPMPTLPAE